MHAGATDRSGGAHRRHAPSGHGAGFCGEGADRRRSFSDYMENEVPQPQRERRPVSAFIEVNGADSASSEKVDHGIAGNAT